jgi:hypothetical protein
VVGLVAIAAGMFLPLLGVSLLTFLALDVMWQQLRRGAEVVRQTRAPAPAAAERSGVRPAPRHLVAHRPESHVSRTASG